MSTEYQSYPWLDPSHRKHWVIRPVSPGMMCTWMLGSARVVMASYMKKVLRGRKLDSYLVRGWSGIVNLRKIQPRAPGMNSVR